MLSGFSHVMLYVHDVERAADWYQQHLGFNAQFVAAPHYGILYHDGMRFSLHLHPAKVGSGDVGHGAIVYFTADDLDQAVAELRGQGIDIEDPRSESGSPRFTSFKDSEGNILGLTARSR